MPPTMLKDHPIKPSAQSQAGRSYKVADGRNIPDLGERKIKAKTTSGQSFSFQSNVADVHKFLMAVSSITAKGNGVWFGPQSRTGTHESYVINMKTKAKIPMTLSNGTYQIEFDVGDYDASAVSPAGTVAKKPPPPPPLAETRVDPLDGGAYTFEEVKGHYKDLQYNSKQIKSYWRSMGFRGQ